MERHPTTSPIPPRTDIAQGKDTVQTPQSPKVKHTNTLEALNTPASSTNPDNKAHPTSWSTMT